MKEEKVLLFKEIYENKFNVTTKVIETFKNNSCLIGFSEIRDNSNCCPIIYIGEKLETINTKGEFLKFAEEVKKMIEDSKENISDIEKEMQDINKFEKIKNSITFKLIQIKNNENYLKDKVYTQFLNLAKVFLIDYEDRSVIITNNLLKIWNKSVEDIIIVANENLKKEEFFITEMSELLFGGNTKKIEIMEENTLYTITNKNKINGAKVLATDFLLKSAEKTKMNVAFLPSSIHELIAIPLEKIETDIIQKLKEMVQEVNADEDVIRKEEILCDNVYIYNFEDKMLMYV